ncbi:uncharacterized protein LOC142362869 isoform X2 [Opisthocomus hoazin]|uniref:uncharacterized protein LOC142362869 isoform X2 n=1 Tax=Opisthocomus hoazin TaxID=30419 RepID=UPI003F53CCDF
MAMPTLPLIVLVLCHTTCILQAQELEEVESDMDSLEKELQQGCSSAHHARERLNRLEKKLARQEKLNFTGGMVETYMFKFMAERFRGLKLSSRMDMKPGGGSRLRHAMNFPAELMEGVQAREAEQKLVCIYIHSPCLFHDADNSSVLNDDVLGAFLQSGSVAGLSRPVEIQFWHDMVLDASNATCVFWQPGASKCGRGRDRGNANSLPPRGHRLSASRAVLAALDVPSMSPSPGCCATLRRQLSGRRGQRGQLEQVRLRDHAHGGHRHLPLQPPHLLRRPAGPGGHPDPGPAGIAHPHQHHRLLPLGCCRPLHPPALLLLQAAAEGHHDQDPHAPPGHAAPAQLQLPAELAAGRRRRGALPHRRRPAARQPSLRPGVDGRRSLPPPPPPRQGLQRLHPALPPQAVPLRMGSAHAGGGGCFCLQERYVWVPRRENLCRLQERDYVLAHQPAGPLCHALLRRPHPALQHAGAGEGGGDPVEHPAAAGPGQEGLGDRAGAHLSAGHHLGLGLLQLWRLPRPPALPLHHPQLPARSPRLPLVRHRAPPDQAGLHQQHLPIMRPDAGVRGSEGSSGAAP